MLDEYRCSAFDWLENLPITDSWNTGILFFEASNLFNVFRFSEMKLWKLP